MPLIQLQTGKTIYISAYEYYFVLKDEDIEEFFQTCIADDLGTFKENPFSDSVFKGKIEIDEIPEVEEPTEFPDFDV